MRFLLPKPSRTATAAAALLAACCLAWSTGALAQKSTNGRSTAANAVRGSTPYA
ncbi:lytic murein transglycosylase B, partial [Mycobacterium tuberculosis]